jgi:hypothetical protein
MQKQPWSGKQLISDVKLTSEEAKKNLGIEERLVSYFL